MFGRFISNGSILGIVMYVTKPDEKSFYDYFKKEIQKDRITIDPFNIINGTLSYIILQCSTVIFVDMIIFRSVKVSLPDNNNHGLFIGAFGKWFHIPQKI